MKPSRHIQPFFRGLCFAVALGAMTGNASRAQLSRSDDPNSAPNTVSPFAGILGSIGNLIEGSTADQRWDSVRRQYRGNLLQYLYYPEIPRAGYSRFSLISTSRSNINLEDDQGIFSNTLEQTEHQVSMDDHRSRVSYHFDTSGWLRAIITKTINPEYEAYAESSDSLFYSFYPDGSVLIRWQQDQHSSGSGNGASSDCGPLLPFHQIYRHVSTLMALDSLHNTTSISSRTDERWDTCTAGGPKLRKRTMSYDAEGRLIRATDSSSHYNVPTHVQTISYESMPFEAFAERVKNRPAYIAFREAAVKSWLAGQGKLSCIIVRSMHMHFLRYDNQLHREALRIDSPSVSVDTTVFIVNTARQLVEYTPGGYARVHTFYSRGRDLLSGAPLLYIQNLPLPPEANTSGSTTVCYPLALSTTYNQSRRVKTLGTDTLIMFATDERPDNYGNYSAIRSGQQFNPSMPDKVPLYIRAMSLTDKQGLLKYLWLANNAYKITYQ